jgi:hypothetical protein
VFATAFDYSGPPLSSASADGDLRRAVVGIAMGMTAIAPGKEQEREHIPQKGEAIPMEWPDGSCGSPIQLPNG